MERVAEVGDALAGSLDAADRLRVGLRRLSPVLRRIAKELSEVFSDWSLSKELDDNERPVMELFVAWREVGEACESLAGKTDGLEMAVRHRASQADAEREQRLAEAKRLRSALAEAEKPIEAPRRGVIGWLAGRAEPEPRDEAAERARVEAQRATTEVCLGHLVEQLEAARSRAASALDDELAEARRQAKAVGEKLSVLKPSWRGVSGTRARPQIKASEASPPKMGAKSRVGGLIRTLSTAEGRQRYAEEEAARIESVRGGNEPPLPEEVMMAPPIEQLGDNEWRIRGVYDHQVLKAGLRRLDLQWPEDGLDSFPQGKNGILREKLMKDLILGEIRLQSIPTGDVTSAQRDLHRLSLRQLLRLRVLHLDYAPSGTGADTVFAVGATHEAFMGTLDSQLFRQLGRRAMSAVTDGDQQEADAHRLGREAVLFVAAAGALEQPPWWVWWVTQERRVFFHAFDFKIDKDFPEAAACGVLEVTDFSRPDKHEPTGRLRWLDWRVARITDKATLSAAPLLGGGNSASAGNDGASVDATAMSAGDSGVGKSESLKNASVGAATASMVSPEVLFGARKSLKKTGRVVGAAQAAPAPTEANSS